MTGSQLRLQDSLYWSVMLILSEQFTFTHCKWSQEADQHHQPCRWEGPCAFCECAHSVSWFTSSSGAQAASHSPRLLVLLASAILVTLGVGRLAGASCLLPRAQ